MRRQLAPAGWPIALKLSVTLLLVGLVPAIGASYFALQEGLSRLGATEYGVAMNSKYITANC